MQAVKWVVATLQGDKNLLLSAGENEWPRSYRVTIQQQVFHGTLWRMDFWTPPHFLKGEGPEGNFSTCSNNVRAELYVTDLRWRSPICSFLRVFARIFGFSCENLRFSVVSCALQMLEFLGEGVNLRKSAVFCENLRFGLSLSLSPY